MSDFKDRLKAEHEKLKYNVNTLETYLREGDLKDAGTQQITLLVIQCNAMKTYLSCLCARIALL